MFPVYQTMHDLFMCHVSTHRVLKYIKLSKHRTTSYFLTILSSQTLKTQFVPIHSWMTELRRNPALFKPPWNTFDNTGCKLSHGDPSQTRPTRMTQAKIWAHGCSSREGMWTWQIKCSWAGQGEGREGFHLSDHDKSPHELAHYISLSLSRLRELTTAERTSDSDGVETDGSETNHQSLGERQGRSHLSLDANRWQTA